MNKRETLRRIEAARSLAEIAEAWRIRGAYLDEHPDDFAVIESGGYLSRWEEALRMSCEQEAAVPSK